MICRGVVDQQEWEAARHAAHTQIPVREQGAAQRPPANLLSKPWDGRRFIPSTRREARIARRFQSWAAACPLVFMAAGAISGFVISISLTAPVTAVPTAHSGP